MTTEYNLEKVQQNTIVSKSLKLTVNKNIQISIKKIDNGYILEYQMYDILGPHDTDIVNELFCKELPRIIINTVE